MRVKNTKTCQSNTSNVNFLPGMDAKRKQPIIGFSRDGEAIIGGIHATSSLNISLYSPKRLHDL